MAKAGKPTGNGPEYGPENPHPLSQIKTELVWEGKYDEYGNRREVQIGGADLPLQWVEAIDEPRSRALGEQTLFDEQKAHQDDFRNMLIWGDNKLVMASLLEEFKGKIDLIYIDPPFDVGADFTMDISIGEKNEKIEKDQSILESVAYRDTWGKGTDSYIHMMYERFVIIKDLLKESGSIYVHCDWRVNSLLRRVLDEVFSQDNFINEIIWSYKTGGISKNAFARKHETLLFFSKTQNFKFNTQYYKSWQAKKYNYSEKYPEYFDEETKRWYHLAVCRDVWDDVYVIGTDNKERLDFPTQKPEALLKRIIEASSNKDELVADFFCGSGTTGAVAEKLGRRWIMADLGRFSIHTSRKRMIEIQRQLYAEGKPYRAFDVYNMGRYERQWWQRERLSGADEEHRRIVLAFYRAEELTGAISPLLHGRKGPVFVNVDGIDSILTLDEVKAVAEATQTAGAKEVHCLAWEFEMELKRNAEAVEHEYGVKVRLIRIPREVMEKNRRPGVDEVPFFEMATLAAEPIVKIEGGERIVDVKLTNFLPSLSEVPGKELDALKERAVKSGFDFIDFWAVDFDHQDGQPFKHHWQDYRLRKDRSLKLQSDCGYTYKDAKTHTICVKVIDTFGCDTSILLEVSGARNTRKNRK